MNRDQQEEHLRSVYEILKEVQLKKGNDYAGDLDRLKNFKVAGAICGITAAQQCLSLIATKVARLGTLLGSNKAPCNETIMDSVLDLISYSILLDMLLAEQQITFT